MVTMSTLFVTLRMAPRFRAQCASPKSSQDEWLFVCIMHVCMSICLYTYG
eukprot:m.530146 g.530146  ORF g.530146 m.530146 type:complete len:50 (-) comp22026_c0_seq2:15-164(-)